METNDFIISHGKCSDGLSAAHILQSICSAKDKDVYFLEHSQDDIAELESKGFWQRVNEVNCQTRDYFYIYIADYCPDISTLKRLLAEVDKARVVILDHHKTAYDDIHSEEYQSLINEYQHRIELYFDMRFSGATLAWLYVYEISTLQMIVNDEDKSTPSYKMEVYKTLPTWLRYVMSRDIWQWVEDDAKPFADVFKNYCTTLADMREYFPLDNPLVCLESVEMMVKEGHLYRKMLEGQLALMLKTGRKEVIRLPNRLKKVEVFAINLPAIFSSDAAEYLFSRHSDIDIVLAYRILDNKVVDFSLRSRTGVDCSVIAKAFGGGGHPQASGFKIPLELLYGFFK